MNNFDRNDFDGLGFYRKIYETIDNIIQNFIDEYYDKYNLDYQDHEKIEKLIYKKLNMEPKEINNKIEEAIMEYIKEKNNLT